MSKAFSFTAPTRRQALPLILLILFQSLCTMVFLTDVFADLRSNGFAWLTDLHLLPELGAALGLGFAIIYEGRVLLQLLRQQARLQQGMSVAAGALSEVMEGYFQSWNLTPAEADVAGFTVKGFSISEIAGLRGSAEGTIKTHLNAIYRKADVAGRAQLVSLLVEDLFRAPLLQPEGGGILP